MFGPNAGGGFFWRFFLLFLGGGRVAPLFQVVVDQRHIVHIGHKVHDPAGGTCVFNHGEQHIFLGVGPEVLQVALFDVKGLEFPARLKQPGHVGLAVEFFVVLGQGHQKGGQVFAPSRQHFNSSLGELDALLYHQVGHFTAVIHLLHLPVFKY